MSRRPLQTAVTFLAVAILLGCTERTLEPPPPPPPPPPPAHPVYRVLPPEGKLPWPHHNPAWEQARYDAMLDSIWVINNFGAYTGTSDRSMLYLHDALDLVLPNGTPIYAIAPGVVRLVISGNEFYTSVFIEDEEMPGYGWGYTHIYRLEVGEGDRVPRGARLGVVNFQGVEHIHLNRVRLREGGSWLNFRHLISLQPDPFFVFRDTEPPEFVGSFRYLRNLTDSTFTAAAPGEPVTVSGEVDIVVALRDPGEWTRSKVPFAGFASYGDAHAVSRIEYDIEGADGVVHRAVAFDFSRLEISRPTEAERAAQLLTIFQHYESANPPPPTGTLGNRRFNFYVITNSSGRDDPELRPIDPADQARSWRTAERNPDGTPRFPNGEYTVTVRAYDSSGNRAEQTERVRVRN